MQSYYIIFEKQKIWFHNSIFFVQKSFKNAQIPPRFAVTLHVTALQFRISVCVTCHVTNLNSPDSITVLFYFLLFSPM